MNNKLSKEHQANLDRHVDVDMIIEKFITTHNIHPAFTSQVILYQANLPKLKLQVQKYINPTTGNFDLKIIAKKDLADTIGNHNNQMIAYCMAEDKPNLLPKFEFSKSDIFTGKDGEISLICQNIIDETTALLPNLANYLIDNANIIILQDKLDEFVLLRDTVDETVIDKDSIYNHMVKLFGIQDDILKILSRIVYYFEFNAPRFFMQFNKATMIYAPQYHTINISGEVMDKADNKLLEDAIVSFTLAGENLQKITNMNGYFQWIEIPAGIYQMHIERFGYISKIIDFEITSTIPAKLEIYLDQIPTA